ncbi:MAG: hypothetical protein H6981_05455 [Gammaproteobacteria bacterium]|nr:hypothetical protein [Gammaproteobacteria bacterium]MCP5136229.1 hypothetical protein [Gammaproteobacteria bacterium]
MDLSSDSVTADKFQARLGALIAQVSDYEHGQVQALSEIAHTIVMGHEYWIGSDRPPVLTVPFQREIEDWYENIYPEQVVFVLRNGNQGPFGYSRRFILKQLRGHAAHADQKDRSPKEEVFRNYIFEADGASTVEFALTWNWLFTGGVQYPSGNIDSKNPLVEKITINERPPIKVTTIESAVLSIAAEFWQIGQTGHAMNMGRVTFTTDESQLMIRFGAELGQKCYQTVLWQQRQMANFRAHQQG